MQRIFFVTILFELLLVTRLSAEEKIAPLTIDSIEARLFDQTTGKQLDLTKPPNDYGLDMDLLVLVKVKGSLDYAPALSLLELKINAKGWSDPATGSHSDWKLAQKISFHRLPEQKVRYFLFVVPYQDCYSKVILGAHLQGRGGGAKKSQEISLACAE
jgi:hypothetical protein